jgi:hypothetical protein
MIKLGLELETPPRRGYRRAVVVGVTLLALLVLIFAALILERLRGQYALKCLKRQMAERGEVLEANRIWPRPSLQALNFSNLLQRAVGLLPKGLDNYMGRISALIVQEPGIARRGSQERIPVMAPRSTLPATWQDLAEQVRQAQPALQIIRNALRNPPPDMGYNVRAESDSLNIPNFVNVRRTAQALEAATLSDLHNGNLEGAKENLVALGAFSKFGAQDPTLVSYMIRIAILGLSTEAAWDSLQADGWSDGQLAGLQQAFHCDQLLAQMPRTMEAERAGRCIEFRWLQSHSYGALVDRFQPLYESFGLKVPGSGAALLSCEYRKWIFHPLWRLSWADQEQALYLENQQRELEILREASKVGSWKQARAGLKEIETDYRPPSASWRFYLTLPLVEEIPQIIGGQVEHRRYPYTRFNRAWSTSMKNLTLCHMLTTAIALRRYELRHAKKAARLDELVPDFMDEVPRDLMDGQCLRYAIRPNGTWCLYSVGDDTQDDHGDPAPKTSDRERPSPWDGRDWVWPRVASVH